MNALQEMDRYLKKVIQASTYKERYKGSLSLRYAEIICFNFVPISLFAGKIFTE